MRPPEQQPVTVRPDAGVTDVVEDWVRGGANGIGMGDPALYRNSMGSQQPQLESFARTLLPEAPRVPANAVLDPDPLRAAQDLMDPALAAVQARYPDADVRLVAVEAGAVQVPNGYSMQDAPFVIEVQNGSETEHFTVQPPSDYASQQMAVGQALAADPALLDSWYSASQRNAHPAFQDYGDAQMSYNMTAANGGLPVAVEGIAAMPPEAQAAFYEAYADAALVPVVVEPDQVLVSVDASAVASGAAPASFESTVNAGAVDGLRESTALPAPSGVSSQDWRAALETMQANPPGSIQELETAMLQVPGMTADTLRYLKAGDPGAVPAVYSLVSGPPDIAFNDQLDLSILPGGRGQPATFDSIAYETVTMPDGTTRGVAVIDTSLDRLLGDQADLDQTYAVSDIPMTIRVPLPAGAPTDWTHPTTEQFAMLNGQIQSIGTTDLFLHGYQSTREVWNRDMQDWMNLSNGDSIGIAMAGMGSEGDALGTGSSPFTPRQYASHTLEALDRLGLFGKEINVVGHSMGGAAAMEMGLAVDELAAGGLEHPDMRYVLLAPAAGPDSVPFLTQGWESALISVQNFLGTGPTEPTSVDGYPVITGPGLAYIGNDLVGGLVVGHLIPGAPDYIQGVHSDFANVGGFPQLAATAYGLTNQGYPDPAAVERFMANNPVLVVAASEDKLVAPEVVEDVFGPDVLTVAGNHYAHLPVDGDATSQAEIFRRAAEILNAPFAAQGGGGGGGRPAMVE
jgi:pimeloyl-ACP methyl ester carboxylesterase